jgi:hypothetical protein
MQPNVALLPIERGCKGHHNGVLARRRKLVANFKSVSERNVGTDFQTEERNNRRNLEQFYYW